MEKKFKLTDEYKHFDGHVVYRIEALRSFGSVYAGERGGFVEHESNLSQEGDCWVTDDAVVLDNGLVSENAWLCDQAVIMDNAIVDGYAVVRERAIVCYDAHVGGYTYVMGDEVIKSESDFTTYDIGFIYADMFLDSHITHIHDDDTWITSMYKGDAEGFLKHAYKRHKEYGERCEALVRKVLQYKEEQQQGPVALKYGNSFPVSWADYCEHNPVKKGECFINNHSDIISSFGGEREKASDKNLMRDRAMGEAFIALMQLMQLRDSYRHGWAPDYTNSTEPKYGIIFENDKIECITSSTTQTALSFDNMQARDKFLECFRDLIMQAKELI